MVGRVHAALICPLRHAWLCDDKPRRADCSTGCMRSSAAVRALSQCERGVRRRGVADEHVGVAVHAPFLGEQVRPRLSGGILPQW